MESTDSTVVATETAAINTNESIDVTTTGISGQDNTNDRNDEASNRNKKTQKRKVSITEDSKNVSLPRASVKRIMKLPENVGNITGEAAAVVAKATELFLEKIVLASSAHTQSCKKKQIKLENIASIIHADQKKYEFLNNAFGPLKKI